MRQQRRRSIEFMMINIDELESQEEFNFHFLAKELRLKMNWLCAKLCRRVKKYKVRRFLISPISYDDQFFYGGVVPRGDVDPATNLFVIDLSGKAISDTEEREFIEDINSSYENLDAVW